MEQLGYGVYFWRSRPLLLRFRFCQVRIIFEGRKTWTRRIFMGSAFYGISIFMRSAFYVIRIVWCEYFYGVRIVRDQYFIGSVFLWDRYFMGSVFLCGQNCMGLVFYGSVFNGVSFCHKPESRCALIKVVASDVHRSRYRPGPNLRTVD
jgi:hypothetical protein